MAVICRCETREEISLVGNARKDFFSKFLDLKNGIPSKDTFRRFFAKLDSKVFEDHFIKWAQSSVKDITADHVSIDGKTIRQASKMLEESSIHLVNAWADEHELILGQVKTDDKSSEITAIPILLESLFLEGTTVTIDAMGCQAIDTQ